MRTRSQATLTGRWQLDPQRSSIKFRVRHFWGLMTVEGHFDDYEGSLDFSADPAMELTIESASLQTGNRKRDEHLRSPDFFDTENEPRVRFLSESVDPGEDTVRVHGRLFARSRSIALDLDARIRYLGDDVQIEATTTARHRELGMTWSPLRMIPPRSQLLVSGYLVPV